MQDTLPNTLSTAGIRRANREEILRTVFLQGGTTRLQLVKHTGLTGAAVSRITRELIEAGLLVEGERVQSKGKTGRKEVTLSMAQSTAFVLGFTVTANRLSVGVSDVSGTEIETRQLHISRTRAEEVLRALCETAHAMIAELGLESNRIIGVGVMVAAASRNCVDGVVTSAPLGWTSVPVGQLIEENMCLPVSVEVRAVSLLQVEMARGQGAGQSDLVLVNNSLGVGAAAVLGGVQLAGASCDIAHLAFAGDSRPCACGRKGCLESTASGFAVVDQLIAAGKLEPARDSSRKAAALARALQMAEDGDGEVKRAFFEAGQRMALGLDAVAALLGPSSIILAGETGRQPDFVEGARNHLRSLRVTEPDFELLVSQVTSNTAVINYALERFLFSSELDLDRLQAD
ncbi:N-acetylglucosamine repressor [Falsiruegeria litorea R37]|uniref:N-acetylglucosamine repressor n=1 Tax=Falsiruegeria litorea R37 TaxID=1200284 RepID=A0A1Y5RPB1_9RHOB|nr:ROK family protein [Falsiruegeria litorea]SLN21028.1 N-acetylglucosamine repressor [Falsiruegeria litorea R37]